MGEATRSLRLLAGPVLVLSLALFLFELAGFDLPERGSEVAAALAEDPREGLLEVRARLLWLTTVLLYFTSAAAATVVGLRLLRGLPVEARTRYLAAGLVLLGVQLVVGLAPALAPAFRTIYEFTSEALAAAGVFDGNELARIRTVVLALNLVSAVVPPVVLLAGCAAAAVGEGPVDARNAGAEVDRLAERMRGLRSALNAGSALLVTGILHMLLWMRWPAALTDLGTLESGVLHVASSVSLYWGAAYSLLAAAWFLPASARIAARARAVVDGAPELAGEGDARDWLARRGLVVSAARQVPQVLVILGPLLAGPIGSALTELGSAVG